MDCRGITIMLVNAWENPGKITENVGKIPKHLGKLPENPGKNGTQRCLFQKMAPNICRKTSKTYFLEITPKKVFMIFESL